MALVAYEWHPRGRRCYVGGRRLHHYLAGQALAVGGVGVAGGGHCRGRTDLVVLGAALVVAGAICMWDDRADRRIAWRDWRGA